MMVRFLFVTFLGALMLPLSPLLCFAAYGQNAEVIDGIAAVVNESTVPNAAPPRFCAAAQ